MQATLMKAEQCAKESAREDSERYEDELRLECCGTKGAGDASRTVSTSPKETSKGGGSAHSSTSNFQLLQRQSNRFLIF